MLANGRAHRFKGAWIIHHDHHACAMELWISGRVRGRKYPPSPLLQAPPLQYVSVVETYRRGTLHNVSVDSIGLLGHKSELNFEGEPRLGHKRKIYRRDTISFLFLSDSCTGVLAEEDDVCKEIKLFYFFTNSKCFVGLLAHKFK